ncbi:TetR/AcrR family transcriptional regulator [Actinoplanes sp. NPDC049118]|uniref:TetR/AcrR family transcriptional regulator n=1 Tax=Actinoplanes sp. NPDC049118 TaxID=3155769 RepID=UPI0033FF9C2B
MTLLYGAQTSRRRDAQRNRAAIIAAASEVLNGPEPVSLMPEVARRAGVGQATLYRHFPDRHALTVAVIGHYLQVLESAAAASVERPALFRQLLREVLHTLIKMRPLVLLAQRLDADARRRYIRRAIAALSPPLRSAQESGYVRHDLVPDDLILLFTMVRGAAEATGDVVSGLVAGDRSIDLVLDGVFL